MTARRRGLGFDLRRRAPAKPVAAPSPRPRTADSRSSKTMPTPSEVAAVFEGGFELVDDDDDDIIELD